MKFYRVIINV